MLTQICRHMASTGPNELTTPVFHQSTIAVYMYTDKEYDQLSLLYGTVCSCLTTHLLLFLFYMLLPPVIIIVTGPICPFFCLLCEFNTIFGLQFNHSLLDHSKILHMPQQHSYCVMCKVFVMIAWVAIGWEQNEIFVEFELPQYDGKYLKQTPDLKCYGEITFYGK